MSRLLPSLTGWTTVVLAVLGYFGPAAAQDFYAGKRLTILVGLEAGGTVDTLARQTSNYLRKHLPGNPTIVIQNMPGAGGWTATNYLQERAAPDGTTILYGPWDPLGQALADQGLRARYEKFDFLGGTGDIRVTYGRTDIVPGGIKAPRDIMKAANVLVGALNNTDISGLLPHLTLNTLGVKNKMIVGYRGGNDVFLAMQRGEIQFHSTSISSFRTRNAAFIKSGQGIGIAYLVPVDHNGTYVRSPEVNDVPAFPDLSTCGDLAVPGAEDLADAADVDRTPARSVRQRTRPAVTGLLFCGRPWFPIECHHMAPGLATRASNHVVST